MLGKINKKIFFNDFSCMFFFAGVFSLNHTGVHLVSLVFLTNHLNIRVSFEKQIRV
jgi:hypothetical protein